MLRLLIAHGGADTDEHFFAKVTTGDPCEFVAQELRLLVRIEEVEGVIHGL